jgi:fructose 5-dehydrogenase cytochrome subunit
MAARTVYCSVIEHLRTAIVCLFAGAAICAHAQGDTPEVVERGRYLAIAGDCTGCHTRPDGGKPFAGGYAISSPLGAIYSTNITPSRIAGIGRYSEARFVRAMRQGIRRDGAHLYPAMPYTAYTKVSDADMHALYVYFMQAVTPVDLQPPRTSLSFPFNMRVSMAMWNALFLSDARFTPDPNRSARWNRGAYVAEALEHCSACHTPRNLLMAEQTSRNYSGTRVDAWYAPNITSDPVSGIGAWTRDELVQYLKTGVLHPKSQAAGGMAEAVTNSLQYLTSQDLDALATYLLSSPPIRDQNQTRADDTLGRPARFEARLRGQPTTAGSNHPDGAALYSGYCASCHQPSGAGTSDLIYPALFHNTATGSRHVENLIAAILFGVDRKVGDYRAFMPPFGADSYVQTLTDAQVASVSNYVLQAFGESSVRVAANDVATARRGGPTPLLARAPQILLIVVCIAFIATGGWLLLRRQRSVRP